MEDPDPSGMPEGPGHWGPSSFPQHFPLGPRGWEHLAAIILGGAVGQLVLAHEGAKAGAGTAAPTPFITLFLLLVQGQTFFLNCLAFPGQTAFPQFVALNN